VKNAKCNRHVRLATRSSRHALIPWNNETLNADVQRKQARVVIGQYKALLLPL
jgi:hypothetical protein